VRFLVRVQKSHSSHGIRTLIANGDFERGVAERRAEDLPFPSIACRPELALPELALPELALPELALTVTLGPSARSARSEESNERKHVTKAQASKRSPAQMKRSLGAQRQEQIQLGPGPS
jgi:hypothetical protein